MTTTYTPNFVTQTTEADGSVVVSFLSRAQGLNENLANHQVPGYKSFVAKLHKGGFKASGHLESTVNASGFYHYSQSFKL